jgi:hypothetical protein
VTRNQSDFGHKLGNSIHIWYQKNDSIWEEDIINCSHGEGIRVIDLEDDGDADIVIGESWFENKGGKQKVEWERHGYAEWYKANCVDVADLNGDGYKDIILTPSELANKYYRISWFEAPKTLPDGRWVEHVLSDSTECVIHSLRVNDFNDDNLPDILYAEMHQGTDPDEVVLMMNRKHGKSWTKKIISTNGSHMLQLIDYDQDSDLDFFGANWSGPFQPVQLWENISGK